MAQERCKWCSKPFVAGQGKGKYCCKWCQKEGRTQPYSRAEFEKDMDFQEEVRHGFRKMLLEGTIDGFTFVELMTDLDGVEAKAKAKLFVTRMRLQDKDIMRNINATAELRAAGLMRKGV